VDNSKKWLENLQKATHPTSALASAHRDADKPNEFADLFRVDGDDVMAPTIAKVFDDDPDFADIGDPVTALIKTMENERYRIPPVAEPHADGVFFERFGDVVWTWHYEGGELVKSECVDPALPAGRLVLDGHGNEIDLNKGATTIVSLRWDSPISASGLLKKQSDGAPLSKADISSRMATLLSQIRGDCVGNEETLLKKAIAALDLSAFTQITTSIIERLKRQRAA
jgi:hypothetical protein